MTLLDEAQEILPELQQLRRELHREPELGLDLPKSQRRVLDALEGLPLEIHLGENTTSVTAVLRGNDTGPAVLLRGDMDALPVDEETGLDFASTNGNMHACGHDLHTAGLVGAAKLLCARRDELPGTVVFMFQPGEEGQGGAKVMIDEGILQAAGKPPVAAYAIHVAPGPRGVVGVTRGTTLAGSSELFVTMHGRGGHASQPQTCADPVPPIAELVTQLQVMLTRRFDAFDPVVITVGTLSAGTAVNIIPPSASLGATVRTMSPQTLAALPPLIDELANGIAAAHGCRADVEFLTQYIPTVNDDAETDFAIEQLRGLLGDDAVQVLPHGRMGAEDFSFILDEVPGTFFFLLCSPDGVDPETAASNHSPKVMFDDAILAQQAAMLADLALARLAQG